MSLRQTATRALLPALLLAGALAPPGAAQVIDDAGLFPPGAEAEATQTLDRIAREQGVPVRIETIESLRSAVTPQELSQWKDLDKLKVVDLLAVRRAASWSQEGVFILLSRQDKVISVLVHPRTAGRIPDERRKEIRDTFVESFAGGDYADGLLQGVARIEAILQQSPAPDPAAGAAAKPAPAAPGAARPAPAPRNGGWPTWLKVLLVVVVVFLVLRLIGGLLGAGRAAARPGPMGGHHPGAPGYGGYGGGPGGYGGYGGGGGGFLTGMFGGLGGALLGNWLYDRISGHHPPDAGPSPGDQGVAEDPNRAASWGEPTDAGHWHGVGDAGSWGGDAGGDWSAGGDGGGDWGGDGGGDW